MRALVTGAAGFVGRHLCRRLLGDGIELAGLVHPEDPAAETLPKDVKAFAADLLDDAAVSHAVSDFAPDAIFHLAAFSNPEGSWKEARRTLEINVIGAHQLLAAAFGSGRTPRVLLVGSSQQYGEVPEEEQPIAEGREQKPLTPYAVSKTSQEILGLRAFWSSGLPVFLTRSFNHTGPGQSDSYVCSSFARQIVRMERHSGERVLRVGNLSVRRDFTDVRDVVEAYLAILDRGRPGRPYNVCRGVAVSIREVVDTLLELSRAEVEVEVDRERYHSRDVPLVLGDSRRIAADTGWSPRFALRDTLRDLLDDWRTRV